MTGLMPPSPLSYQGQLVTPFINRKFPPTSGFVNFTIPTIWTDTQGETSYMLVSLADGIATWQPITGTVASVQKITTPDAVVVIPVADNINFHNGTGMNITGSGNNITFNSTNLSSPWSLISASQTLLINNNYVCTSGSDLLLQLPAVSFLGNQIIVVLNGASSFSITQGVGQQIRVSGSQTTSGVGGSITTTGSGDCISLVCTSANTQWLAYSYIGNLTVV